MKGINLDAPALLFILLLVYVDALHNEAIGILGVKFSLEKSVCLTTEYGTVTATALRTTADQVLIPVV